MNKNNMWWICYVIAAIPIIIGWNIYDSYKNIAGLLFGIGLIIGGIGARLQDLKYPPTSKTEKMLFSNIYTAWIFMILIGVMMVVGIIYRMIFGG